MLCVIGTLGGFAGGRVQEVKAVIGQHQHEVLGSDAVELR